MNGTELNERLARLEAMLAAQQKALDKINETLDCLNKKLYELVGQQGYTRGQMWGVAAVVSAIVSAVLAGAISLLGRMGKF